MAKQVKKKKEKQCHPVESVGDGGVVVNTNPTPPNKCGKGQRWDGTKCVDDVG